MKSYLTNRLQSCKINNSFSEWVKVFAGVLQGSVLGPLLLNIFLNDIFLSLQKCDLAVRPMTALCIHPIEASQIS